MNMTQPFIPTVTVKFIEHYPSIHGKQRARLDAAAADHGCRFRQNECSANGVAIQPSRSSKLCHIHGSRPLTDQYNS